MNRRSKKGFTFIIAIIMFFLYTIPVYATDNPLTDIARVKQKYGVEIVSPEEAKEIEELAARNDELRSLIKNGNIAQEKSSSANMEITINENRMRELGAQAPSNELLCEIIENEFMRNEVRTSNGISPAQLAEDYSAMYDMSDSYTTVHNGRTQFHLIFRSRGNDPYLRVTEIELLYDVILPNSTEAHNWVNEIIKIYAEKLIGEGLGLINPFITFLPYELLEFASRPDASEISAPGGGGTSVRIDATVVQKFVYVYHGATDSWVYALSTNMVGYSMSVTQAIYRYGASFQDTEEFYYRTVHGDYNSAAENADSAYLSGSSPCMCLRKLAAYSCSKSKDMVVVNIYAPGSVIDMDY